MSVYEAVKCVEKAIENVEHEDIVQECNLEIIDLKVLV